MSTALKIANLLRTPIYFGAKGIELSISLFTPSHNFTFGQFIGASHFLSTTAGIGFEAFTEAAVKGSNAFVSALPFSDGILGLYEHLFGIDVVKLYTKVLKYGDIDSLKMLLARNVTKNQILLNDILRTEQDEAARYLIENGFVNHVEVNFNKVLCYATSNPTAEMTEFAIENGADINFKCWNRTFPIQEAVQQNSIPNVVTLVKHGAEIPPNIILKYATHDKHLESGMIPYLFNQGISPHYQENNSTAFSLSVAWGEYKLSNYLIDTYKVNVDIAHAGWTPLERAISICAYEQNKCSTNLIRKIIQHKADVRFADDKSILEKTLRMSSKLTEDVSDILKMILCNGKYTAQEVSQYMYKEMSIEVSELLMDFIESDDEWYCLSNNGRADILETYLINDSIPIINNILVNSSADY